MLGVSAITWVNQEATYKRMLLPTITGGHQIADYELQVIIVSQGAGATNIGQAYNMGLERAIHPIKVFAHQDVTIHDRSFVAKLDALLSCPDVGAVGTIGSIVDTGAAFFHAPTEYQKGRLHGLWWPECVEVKVVDGFMLCTKEDIAFSEEYEAYTWR